MQKVLIIAEAGVNHNGSIDLAKKMIDAAADAGADVVKFQTAVPELVISKNAPKAEYQLKTTDTAESQLEMAKKIHLPLSAYKELKEYSEKRKIKFLSTPFDLKSIEVLNELGIDCFKIPSGEITNLPYLQKIGRLHKTVILSTGMSELKEIETALNILYKEGTKKENISVLHCNTEYPTPFSDVNLKAMLTIKDKFNINVGYSDHTLGIEVSIAAVALGATIIEKHFTLDKTMQGPDHKASLEPDELKQMVQAIRNIEQALGNGIKVPSVSESKNITIARKSIVTTKALVKGHVLQAEDLTTKRPGDGISPMMADNVIGKKLASDVQEDTLLTWEMLV